MTRSVVFALACSLLVLFLEARAGEPSRLYGAKLLRTETVALSDILRDPSSYGNRIVAVEGNVSSVCQNKGCWMFVTDGTNAMRVDFKDYGFFVPFDSKGKKVRMVGTVYQKLVSKKVLQHWAEDQKEEGVNPADITEDKMMVMFTATGVEMVGGSEISKEQQEAIDGKGSKE